MSITNNDNINSKEILVLFAKYGFQKTSMEDIAKAAGISRQAIYKKFQSKENFYQQTINYYLADMYKNIFEQLEYEGTNHMSTLMAVFDILIGDAIDIAHNKYGASVFKDVLDATHSSVNNWPIKFKSKLATYLENAQLVDKESSIAVSYALISASKGMLLEKSSKQSFQEDMGLIIQGILRR